MRKESIGWLRNTKSVILLGLETAGKTTLLNQWARGVTSKTTTTIGLDIEHVEVGTEIFNLIDLGGQEPFRITLWKTYAQMAHAIIFLFDITDRSRTADAVKWFWQVEEWISSEVPIMFCANKIDLKKQKGKEVMSLDDIIKSFELQKLGKDERKEHSFRIFEISALTGENVDTAMKWIFSRLQRKEEKPDIRKMVIADIKGKKICNINFINANLKADDLEIENIITVNKDIVSHSNTIQFFEGEEASMVLLAQSQYLCIVSADKSIEEFNSIRVVAETILNLFLTQIADNTFDEKIFRELITKYFEKSPTLKI